MLVFVIPLKGRHVSKSWETVCRLLERSVRSACNQTVADFHVVVVCNEKPDMQFEHPNLSVLEVDFPYPHHEQDRIARGLTDKGRKVLAGLVYAEKFQPSHAMTVDADDCVSNRLAAFVSQSPQANGWFIDRGYKYREGDNFLYLKRKNFYRMAGSANIIRYDLLNLPTEPEYNRGYGYYKFHLDHQKVRFFMEDKGAPIKPLPFAGAVYVLGTGDNMSGNDDKLSFNLFNRLKLTDKLRNEFCVYSLS
jgi:hypothetical protein